MKSLVACDQFQTLPSDCNRRIQSCGQILLIKKAKTSAQLLWLKAPTVRIDACVDFYICVCVCVCANLCCWIKQETNTQKNKLGLPQNNLRICILPEQIISQLSSFHPTENTNCCLEQRGRLSLPRVSLPSISTQFPLGGGGTTETKKQSWQ